MPPSKKALLVTVIRRAALGVGTDVPPPSPPHPEASPTAAAAATTTSLRCMGETRRRVADMKGATFLLADRNCDLAVSITRCGARGHTGNTCHVSIWWSGGGAGAGGG
ncbi:hypothetical protein GCM10010276_41210 [Streptomyces longisporus]|uniref:Uncharacterized protein n=1 Tax=Streptomyces longisporus TaxID=1948 RepID=A0ABN3M6F6_STRLO